MPLQLDLFLPNDDINLAQQQIDKIQDQLGNVRRGTFAKISQQGNMLMKQQERLEDQQRQIDTLRKIIMEMKNK